MAVAVSDIGTVATASSSTTVNPSAPSGSGGTLVMFLAQAIATTPADPTGWTQRATRVNSSNIRIVVWDRQSDGTADDSPTITVASATSLAAVIIRLSGTDSSSFDNAQTTVDNIIDSSGDIPAITVANNDSIQLVGNASTGVAGGGNCTYNSPLSQIVSQTSTRSLSVASGARNAGSIAADTFTQAASGRKSVGTLIYQPAAGGGTTVSPGDASATASAVAPTVILGSVSISPGNASATATAVDPTVVLGSVTVAPGDATATGSAVDPTAVLGSITVSPGAAEATASVVDPAVTGDGISVASGAASATASAVDPTVVMGSIIVTPGAASASGAAVDPAVILGSVTVSPGAATATASAVAPSVSAGEAVEIALGVFFVVEFVVQISIDGGTGGQWDEGIRAPALARGFAAPPIRQTLAAPTLLRTDAEG